MVLDEFRVVVVGGYGVCNCTWFFFWLDTKHRAVLKRKGVIGRWILIPELELRVYI